MIRTNIENQQRSSGRMNNISRTRITTYWIATVLVGAELALGGVWDLLRIEFVRQEIARLGYPEYFLLIMGIWKIPGALVLLIPGLPRLKEWAYAGTAFTYLGALASHMSVGDPAGKLVAPIVLTGLTAISWWLRPAASRNFAPIKLGISISRTSTITYWIHHSRHGVYGWRCDGAPAASALIGVMERVGFPATL
jgi:uncharacterized membrane protein YphA (DoxX/SURF4 family)